MIAIDNNEMYFHSNTNPPNKHIISLNTDVVRLK